MRPASFTSFLTPWKLTRTEFRMMIVYRKTLSEAKTIETMFWTPRTMRDYCKRTTAKFEVDSLAAALLLFDRWCDSSPNEFEAQRQLMGIKD